MMVEDPKEPRTKLSGLAQCRAKSALLRALVFSTNCGFARHGCPMIAYPTREIEVLRWNDRFCMTFLQAWGPQWNDNAESFAPSQKINIT